MTRESYAVWSARLARERREHEALIVSLAAPGLPLLFLGRHGGSFLVHGDTYADRLGRWRVTRFEGDEPRGHTSPDGDLAAAVREAWELGADLATGIPADEGGARGALLRLLVARAVQASAFVRPRRRQEWPTLAEAADARATNPERFTRHPAGSGGAPPWALGLLVRTNLGMGDEMSPKFVLVSKARKRLRVLLAVARVLHSWGGGLRLEELATILGGAEELSLFRLLGWAKARGALVDKGDRGWYLPEQVGDL